MRALGPILIGFVIGCSDGKSTEQGDSAASDTATRDVDQDRDGSVASEDCDDTDPAINPGAEELCDGIDNDCDDLIDGLDPDLDATVWYTDVDGDGYGDEDSGIAACTQPEGTIAEGGDCNDSDAAYHPGADESDCTDPNDYNCDGSSGSDDLDSDGFAACEDCDDGDALVSPTADEICDEIDNDCDGLIDDADSSVSGGSLYYVDADGDGYGTDDVAESGCSAPEGTSATGGDCNDADAAYHPGADESDCSDSHDYNCDGSVAFEDADGDGVAACADCDDSEVATYPGATEICDGVDNDCDSLVDDADTDVADKPTWYADGDGDGFGLTESGTVACTGPAGTVADGGDCDDTDALIHPDATEVCDGADNDCDGLIDDADSSVSDAGTWYADADHDSYGSTASTTTACSAPTGYVATGTDCNDGNASISPSGTEICDSVDDDCDGLVDDADSSLSGATTWYADADSDGYGSATSTKAACSVPAGYVATGTDCNDSNSSVNPGKTEICDGIDNDCDLAIDDADSSVSGAYTWYADADGDHYGDASSSKVACTLPSGYTSDNTDCDDTSKSINPGKDEKCDALDNDCTGYIDDGDVCGCDVDWYGDHAYQFCDTYASASKASENCKDDGYLLVSINDADENTFVYEGEYATYSYAYWWIGLNDSSTEGTFTWPDSTSASYTSWGSGEPSGGRYGDCVAMAPYYGDDWYNTYCSYYAYYVCESP